MAGQAEKLNRAGLDEDESSTAASSRVCITVLELPTLTVRGHQSLLRGWECLIILTSSGTTERRITPTLRRKNPRLKKAKEPEKPGGSRKTPEDSSWHSSTHSTGPRSVTGHFPGWLSADYWCPESQGETHGSIYTRVADILILQQWGRKAAADPS